MRAWADKNIAWDSHRRRVLFAHGGIDAAETRSFTMKIYSGCAFAVLSLFLGAAPSMAQGVTQSPPSPNSGQSMPEPPNSLPEGARTLAPGTTGMQRMGTIGTTRVQPDPETATRAPDPEAPSER